MSGIPPDLFRALCPPLFILSRSIAVLSVWQEDPVFAGNASLRAQVLRGFFGVRPSQNENTDTLDDFAAQLTAWLGAEGNSDCSLETDDDGSLIYDGLDNTTILSMCTGANGIQPIDGYAAYAYDALMAIAICTSSRSIAAHRLCSREGGVLDKNPNGRRDFQPWVAGARPIGEPGHRREQAGSGRHENAAPGG